MYTLPINTALWLNLILVVLVVLALLQGYARGFVRQLFDLVILTVALLGAWFLAFRLGELVPILSRNLGIFEHPIWGTFLHGFLNSVVWFVILLITLTIGLEVLLKPFVRMVRERNELRMIDRLMGSVFSFLRMALMFLLVMTFMLSPLITNGRDVLERTVLLPLIPLADMLQAQAMKLLGPTKIFSEDGEKQDVISDNAGMITKWLIKNGIAEEFSAFIEKGLKNETYTTEDLHRVQFYIDKLKITKDELVDFLKGIGVDQDQIDKALETLKFDN